MLRIIWKSKREERFLWAMLRVLDRESAGEEKRLKVKQKKVVTRARKKMGASNNQPSILDMIRKVPGVVPQPNSGTVPQPVPTQALARAVPHIIPRVVPQQTYRAGQQPSPTQVQARAVPQPIQTQASAQADQAEQPNTLVHPISQPQESSEAFARIGLVPEEVGPKKLKTREHNQQPRPAVEPLLGVVRGGRGVQVEMPIMEGGGCVYTQTGDVRVAASQSNIVMNDPEKSSSARGVMPDDESRVAGVEYVTSSVRRRGNRNIALLIREQREKLKQRRTNAYKRCDRVNSRDVPKEWIQDRSRTMVIIGTDAVSLYPSMEKQESADEVAAAVEESSLKWEGVSWMEATRFLVLGRDEACVGSYQDVVTSMERGLA